MESGSSGFTGSTIDTLHAGGPGRKRHYSGGKLSVRCCGTCPASGCAIRKIMAGQSSDLAQVQPKYVQNSATWILSARSWEFDFSYTISSDSTSDGCFLSNVDGKILPALIESTTRKRSCQ